MLVVWRPQQAKSAGVKMKDTAMVVALVVGSIAMLLIPTMMIILYNIFSGLVKAVKENTLSLERMNGKMELLWHIVGDVPEMKKDLSFLKGEHSKRNERTI